MAATSTTATRFVVRKDRGGWYVYDIHTGVMHVGMAQIGAVALANHLNGLHA